MSDSTDSKPSSKPERFAQENHTGESLASRDTIPRELAAEAVVSKKRVIASQIVRAAR